MPKSMSFVAYRSRIANGMSVMCQRWTGYIFAPFVPVVALFGGWKQRDGIVTNSVVATVVLGQCFIIYALPWLYRQLF